MPPGKPLHTLDRKPADTAPKCGRRRRRRTGGRYRVYQRLPRRANRILRQRTFEYRNRIAGGAAECGEKLVRV